MIKSECDMLKFFNNEVKNKKYQQHAWPIVFVYRNNRLISVINVMYLLQDYIATMNMCMKIFVVSPIIHFYSY